AGGDGGGQDCGIDNVGENGDAGVLCANDKWAGGAGLVAAADGVEEMRIVWRNHDSNHQGAKDVKEEQSVDESAGGLGNVTTGRFRLSCADHNQLRTHNERKCRTDERVPKATETAAISSHNVLLEGVVLPVPEPDPI